MSLPPGFDPSKLFLQEATEEEKLQSWRNNSAAWKGKLTVEEYIGQQAINGNQELTRNGRIRYWIYTDGTTIYTSAETLQKPVVIRSADGKITTEWSYGVAGVFTPVEFRKHGCASEMMRKLAIWFDSDAVPCQFTVLWSAVGTFYEPFGWSIYPTREAVIPTAPAGFKMRASFLERGQLQPLCDWDTEALASRMEHCPTEHSEQICVAFLPTYAQAEWYFASEEYVASKLFIEPEWIPTVKGAQSLDGNVWCYWLHDFNADKLVILRLVFRQNGKSDDKKQSTLESLGHVLQMARAEAYNWGLKEVSIWHPDERVISACRMVLRVEPDVREEIQGNVPCLRWRHNKWGDGVLNEVRWEYREMYPWC
ncbi:hypothetical protein EDB81DRAFT_805042 [Dactylonectria macrodidyma]|uniref:LYC1 C-terminal domain-containing protein n=1 Tax=Dactylonectria macrodidyma TaxID=307937 RepID=A0A9P9E745_9HYPO|nr:hypothetical protein EDB81DRAFT_805042 [Dactylonectria macrodidyma]